ncbi:ftsK/SpoIIIE family protein [Burkholderia humptydooensis]|uniref:FtsK domain-containing protein n=2 Tax=Burkholderia humptydooensis TaxID=430531 RepID=A0ABN0GDK5_9BURK|nr:MULTISPECIES: DNA translocase FtsK [Burkholderia]AJY41293.1 ftsK/SpoIIIE family protein [Burkholderia sp. 2002721687]ALX43322.1 cell division protein FtsK [Burkholderia humptydooensis]EIP90405.1 hypothetical protein A33K_13995 [Burkholderia humptydooensis MSMB43]
MQTVVLGWFGFSAVWFIPLFWRLAKASLPGGGGLAGPGSIRLWLGFFCVLIASCTLATALTGDATTNALGHALAGGFERVFGHVGTPFAMVALFVVGLPWLVGVRWRQVNTWLDASFGIRFARERGDEESRGVADLPRAALHRDDDRRVRRAADVQPTTAHTVNPMAPRQNGRYARPTLWKPNDAQRGDRRNAPAGAAARAAVEPAAPAGWLKPGAPSRGAASTAAAGTVTAGVAKTAGAGTSTAAFAKAAGTEPAKTAGIAMPADNAPMTVDPTPSASGMPKTAGLAMPGSGIAKTPPPVSATPAATAAAKPAAAKPTGAAMASGGLPKAASHAASTGGAAASLVMPVAPGSSATSPAAFAPAATGVAKPIGSTAAVAAIGKRAQARPAPPDPRFAPRRPVTQAAVSAARNRPMTFTPSRQATVAARDGAATPPQPAARAQTAAAPAEIARKRPAGPARAPLYAWNEKPAERIAPAASVHETLRSIEASAAQWTALAGATGAAAAPGTARESMIASAAPSHGAAVTAASGRHAPTTAETAAVAAPAGIATVAPADDEIAPCVADGVTCAAEDGVIAAVESTTVCAAPAAVGSDAIADADADARAAASAVDPASSVGMGTCVAHGRETDIAVEAALTATEEARPANASFAPDAADMPLSTVKSMSAAASNGNERHPAAVPAGVAPASPSAAATAADVGSQAAAMNADAMDRQSIATASNETAQAVARPAVAADSRAATSVSPTVDDMPRALAPREDASDTAAAAAASATTQTESRMHLQSQSQSPRAATAIGATASQPAPIAPQSSGAAALLRSGDATARPTTGIQHSEAQAATQSMTAPAPDKTAAAVSNDSNVQSAPASAMSPAAPATPGAAAAPVVSAPSTTQTSTGHAAGAIGIVGAAFGMLDAARAAAATEPAATASANATTPAVSAPAFDRAASGATAAPPNVPNATLPGSAKPSAAVSNSIASLTGASAVASTASTPAIASTGVATSVASTADSISPSVAPALAAASNAIVSPAGASAAAPDVAQATRVAGAPGTPETPAPSPVSATSTAPAPQPNAVPAEPARPTRPPAPNAFEFHAPAASNVELPTLDLLEPACDTIEAISDEHLAQTGQIIEQRLQEFKVPVTVVGASAGPVITRFEIEPALGVRGSQIVGLMKDLSRGLGLTSIRVVETIPGKTCMGLELPNAKRQIIRLSEILASRQYQHSASQLTIAMGKGITGNPVVTDLAKAPHMLVAGTTGSGKSVAINAMILSLLYKATPEDVRLIMIDPKMLELSVYEGIPHLLAPVVTDMKLAANALTWCVGEMEKRYRLMSALGVRNLASFNQKIRDAVAKEKKIGNPFSLTPDDPEPLSTLPLIVVVIDELADLMMVAGKKIEELIARLAQKARAAGIHLILATQRPSVDVITGLIKANIPTRVAFQVSSKIDSRTILDQMGAESLLGQGDMLFLPPGTGYPQRVHGAFVADEEVHRIVEYLKQFGEPQYEEGILDGPSAEGGAQDLFGEAPDAEADPLYDEAVAFVVRTRRASISSVQRQLRIGYNRAARLVEQMEAAGLVSPMGINGSREVLAPPLAE